MIQAASDKRRKTWHGQHHMRQQPAHAKSCHTSVTKPAYAVGKPNHSHQTRHSSATKPAHEDKKPNRSHEPSHSSAANPADEGVKPNHSPHSHHSSASKPADEDTTSDLLQRFDELQERFQQMFQECSELWQQYPVYPIPGDRKSWRSAWGPLQVLY